MTANDYNPDIIILTETWINSDEVINYNLPGYVSLEMCNNSYRSGGVLIFHGEHLEVELCSDTVDFTTADVLQVLVRPCPWVCVRLICIYRLHTRTCQEFLKELEHTLDRAQEKNLIVTGDINIDTLKNTKITDDYKDLMAHHGLQNYARGPTRITMTSKTAIDHFYCRTEESQLTLDGVAIVPGVTDHLMLTGQLRAKTKDSATIPTNNTKRTLTNFDELNDILNRVEWDEVIRKPNLNDAMETFCLTLKHLIKSHSRDIIVTKKNNHWMGNKLRRKITHKKKLFRKYNNLLDNRSLKNYIRYDSKLRKEIDNARILHYRRQFRKVQKSKSVWSLVNEIKGKKKKTKDTIKTIVINGKSIQNSTDIANIFNKFFCTECQVPSGNHWIRRSLDKTLHLRSDNFNIIDIINSIKGTAKDIYGLNKLVLKKIIFNIIDPLQILIKRCLDEATFPDCLKAATVIPLHKKGHKTDINNYRPISILPIMSKILEKIIKAQLTDFWDKHNVISSGQHGYRIGKSTQTAIHGLISTVCEKTDQGFVTATVFIDFTKAFDTVIHEILLDKLWTHGIRGPGHHLLTTYLTNRSQVTKIEDEMSSRLKISTGVPQGTVLGPILFNVYTNDIFDLRLQGHLVAYADDICLTCWGEDVDKLTETINSDLQVLNEYFKANGLSISKKTKAIVFRENNTDNMTITAGDMTIETVDTHKYLGLILDSQLTFDNHIDHVVKRLRTEQRGLYDMSLLAPRHITCAAFKGLILPHVTYGLTVWGSASMTRVNRVQTILNRITKRTGHPNIVLTRLAKWRRLLSLNDLPLRVRKTAHPRQTTRHRLVTARCKTKTRQVQMPQSALSDFNALPDRLRELFFNANIKFKKEIRKHLCL